MNQLARIVTVLLAITAPACADAIRPEMIIHFKEGALACLSREDLISITMYAIKEEKTKTEAMMVDQGGSCLMIPSTKRLKVISAEYNNPDLDIGLLEIIGDDKKRLNGAWAYSVGAEEVTVKDKPKKK